MSPNPEPDWDATHPELHKLALTISCSHCGALATEACHTMNAGKPTVTHKPRRVRAQRKADGTANRSARDSWRRDNGPPWPGRIA